ncbi:MAG: response regulator transcription factor [Planctomycetes bacterium]|nr:response regulator transcription factor [Planctomycetota bacterium]
MRLLIVEDEEELAETVRRAFVEDGFSVDVATDGESGLFNAQSWDYDAIVLDLMLPRMSGFDVLKKVRAKSTTPVLILTARDGLDDKVKGLNSGADDYLTKPFQRTELIARVRALVRRSAGKPSPLLKVGELEIDTVAKVIRRKGKPVELTPKEFALAEFMAMHRGELVTRTMIYDHLYDENDDSLSNVVDVYVSNLRRKLGKDFIETRRNQGYILGV